MIHIDKINDKKHKHSSMICRDKKYVGKNVWQTYNRYEQYDNKSKTIIKKERWIEGT